MKVLKFGGTSVGSPDAIRKVIEIIRSSCQAEYRVVVVSAFTKVTDQLIALATTAAQKGDYQQSLREMEQRHYVAVRELISAQEQPTLLARIKVLCNELADILRGVSYTGEITPRVLDLVMSFGERLSATVIAAALQGSGIPCDILDARECVITDNAYGNAHVLMEETKQRVNGYFADRPGLTVVTGFIASTREGETTTLGRGGSDYTASIIGALLKASVIEIWTDVEGVLTADPRKVSSAQSITHLTYEEAMELSYFGAKVIYYPTMIPALKECIPLLIKNTFHPERSGTLISHQESDTRGPITAITSVSPIALLQIKGVGLIGGRGMAKRVFRALASTGINIILISQASSEYSICIAIDSHERDRASKALGQEFELEILQKRIEPVSIENESGIIAVVGTGMREKPGTAGRIFSAVGRRKINIRAIAQGSSERNISFVVAERDKDEAIRAIHDEFFSPVSTYSVFLLGTGLIGSTLLSQIAAQKDALTRRHIDLRVCGIANAEKMFIDPVGIHPAQWKETLEKHGEHYALKGFIDRISQCALPNKICVDCTASQDVTDAYQVIVRSGCALVAANKKAQSGDLAQYEALWRTLRETGTPFFYETNVGAALPIISTVKDLLITGDRLQKIEAILSGTLSYIFNTFSKTDQPFSEIVREAKEKGYTEPDPRDDLSGLDVARKIVILAREMGQNISVQDVVREPLLSDTCLKAENVDAFFAALEKEDATWEQKRQETKGKAMVLRFIATIDQNGALISLQKVDATHPFYSLSGSDNIVAFTTARYCDTPLVIKGPGAGAAVTAGGVFADILKVTRNQ